MLKDNLKTLRKNKGLSQEELSIKLNVVRQTVSKWESGLSVPDAEMLITISEIFETPVNEILGENIEERKICYCLHCPRQPPVQFPPEQAQLSGQPMHFAPFFFALTI